MIDNEKYVKVVVNPLEPSKQAGGVNNTDIVITENGVYEPEPPYTGFGKVDVAVPTSEPAVIEPLSVTPTTSTQEIVVPSGVDGYSPINVSAVTASIDSNITAGNIKSGVSILGVGGSLTELNGTTASVTPTTSAQTITPTSPYNAFTAISVNAVTSAIDANIQAGNIKSGVSILGVEGNYSGSAPVSYIEKIVSSGTLKSTGNILNINGATDVGYGALAYAYYTATFPTGTELNMSSLTGLSNSNCCAYMFSNAKGLKSVDLSGLTSISGQYAADFMFYNCTDLESVDLRNWQTMTTQSARNMFSGCTKLTSVNLSSLQRVNIMQSFHYGMARCTSLTTMSFPVLSAIPAQRSMEYFFSGCTSLRTVYFNSINSTTFGSNTNQFSNLVSGCSNVTIHFPSNLNPTTGSTVISSLDTYPSFGGTNTTLLFDLTATS